MRANCTTAATPAFVISFPEKLSSVMGKGFVRSVANPVVLDILQDGHRDQGKGNGNLLTFDMRVYIVAEAFS